MSGWTVYWLFQLDSISCFFCVLAWVGVGLTSIAGLCHFIVLSGDEVPKTPIKVIKVGLALFLTTGLLSTFIPSTKTMAAIIVLPKIASAQNLEIVSHDAGDIYKLAMTRLKDALGEEKK